MLRISWPLAIVIGASIYLVARRPTLLVPLLVVFAVWFLWESRKRRR